MGDSGVCEQPVFDIKTISPAPRLVARNGLLCRLRVYTKMATETNKACLLYGPGDARFEEIPIPSLENNPQDVLVRIAYTGVCGSDVSSHDPILAGLAHHLAHF